MLGLVKVLEKTKSFYNGEIEVVKTIEGVRIVVGGISQSGWLVKKVWEAALKKLKKQNFSPRKVLILGLGGGSAAMLVEEFWPYAKTIGIDIDPVMVDLGQKYLGLAEVKNLKFIKSEAREWVAKTKEKFDLVLVDLYKGGKIPKEFYQENFVRRIRLILEEGGAAAFNHLHSLQEKKDAQRFSEVLHKVFSSIVFVQPEANIIFICYT